MERMGVLSLLLLATTAPGQEVSREPAIKAAYLYNFGKYVEWPKAVFDKQNSPLVIGIVGPSEVAKYLSVYTRADKRVQGRPVEVTQWADPKSVGSCHILFVSQLLDAGQRKAVVAAMDGKPVLLVSDQDVGGVRFFVEQNRMRVQIAANQVRARGLKVSSKLLQIAQVVE